MPTPDNHTESYKIMNATSEFLAIDDLSSTTGGRTAPDFASGYKNTLKKDLLGLGGREHAAVNNLKKHQ